MGVTVSVNLDGVRKKLSPEGMKRGQQAMANQMLADMNQFVPKKSGTLRMSGAIAADGSKISWNTKYAKAQFYGPSRGPKKLTDKQRRFIFWALKNGGLYGGYSTPGTCSRWDLKAKGMYMPDWKIAFVKGAKLS